MGACLRDLFWQFVAPLKRLSIVLVGVSWVSSCKCSQQEKSELGELATKGKSLYNSTCIACHNVNPLQPGSLGPDLWGSSRELLEAKVLTGTYPDGYKPKRGTHAMSKLSLTKTQLDGIAAYLNSR